MRLVLAVLFLICQAAAGQSIIADPARMVQVRSYVRKDGTVVAAYTRAAPGTGTAPRSTASRRAYQAQKLCPSTAARTGPVSGVRRGSCGAFGLRRDRCARKHAMAVGSGSTCQGQVGAQRLRTASSDSECRTSLRTFDRINTSSFGVFPRAVGVLSPVDTKRHRHLNLS